MVTVTDVKRALERNEFSEFRGQIEQRFRITELDKKWCKEHCGSIVAQLYRKKDESKELIKAIINHQNVPLESLLNLCHRFDLDPPQRRYTVYCIRTSGVPVAFVQKHLTVLGLEPALIHLVRSRKPNKAVVDFLKQHLNEQNMQDFEKEYLENRYKQLFSGQ